MERGDQSAQAAKGGTEAEQPRAAGPDPSFIALTSEQNPERTPADAALNAQVADALQAALAADGRDLDTLIAEFGVAKEEKRYSDQSKLEKTLKLFVDQATLHGQDPDPRIGELFAKSYVFNSYSDVTHATLSANIDVSNLEYVAALLRDPHFTNRYALLARIKGDDQYEKLAALVDYQPDVVSDFMTRIKDVDKQSAVLRAALQVAARLPDKERERALDRLRSPQHIVAEDLVKEGKYDQIIELIDQDVLTVDALQYRSLQDVPPQFVEQLVTRGSNVSNVSRAAKFISEPKTILALAEKPEAFGKLADDEREEAVTLLREYAAALQTEAKVIQIGRLGDENKFVMGLGSENRMAIGWSNTKRHEYHKDIVRDLQASLYPRGHLRMVAGGAVAVVRPERAGPVRVIFKGRSGDFGEYNQHVLKKFVDQIKPVLESALGEDAIEVEIEKSGYEEKYR